MFQTTGYIWHPIRLSEYSANRANDVSVSLGIYLSQQTLSIRNRDKALIHSGLQQHEFMIMSSLGLFHQNQSSRIILVGEGPYL